MRALAVAVGGVALVGCTGTVTGPLPVEDDEPAPVERRVIGRWSDVAAGGGRVVVSGYDETDGDLVIGERGADGALVWTVADGDGDTGAWTSVALRDGLALVAYQDRDAGALRFAAEQADGTWRAHEVDAVAGAELGRYASLAVRGDGVPAIAYMAVGAGGENQLRYAVAGTPSPASAQDWTVEVVARAEAAAIESVAARPPAGTGLFASAAWLPDGRATIAFYDADRDTLRLALRTAVGWAVMDVDAGAGSFASLAAGADGTLHLAYADTARGQLRYLAVAADGIARPVELADDGARRDGRHPVGTDAELALDAGGRPVVFYQDAHDVDLVYAVRDRDGRWVRGELASGRPGRGFYVAAAAVGHTIWVSDFAYDRAQYPLGDIEVFQVEVSSGRQ